MAGAVALAVVIERGVFLWLLDRVRAMRKDGLPTYVQNVRLPTHAATTALVVTGVLCLVIGLFVGATMASRWDASKLDMWREMSRWL